MQLPEEGKTLEYPMTEKTPEKRSIQIAQPATGEEELEALRGPVMSGWLTQGPMVAAFEKAFAERHCTKNAIAVTSCTTALHLILHSLGIGPGDEVVVPAFTWVSTANVVVHCGATPVFADVDKHTFNISPAGVAGTITRRTKAVIPVHLFGLCADIDAVAEAAQGIPIVEDAACAAGSAVGGRPAGGLGVAAGFSFHPRKSITTGEGGMITTNDSELAEKMNILRNHGASISEEQRHNGPKPWRLPDFNLPGFNYRMSDLQGAVGLAQLEKLDTFIAEREKRAAFYSDELSGVEWLKTPSAPGGFRHSFQSYVCMVDEQKAGMSRDKIMEKLLADGISTRPGTHAVHMLGYYRNKLGVNPADFPVARDSELYSLALPLHNRMSADDFAYVADRIKSI